MVLKAGNEGQARYHGTGLLAVSKELMSIPEFCSGEETPFWEGKKDYTEL